LNIKDQRRELTRSIISNLSRHELEKLVLDAALGDARVMREVIRANGGKRDDSSADISREPASARDVLVEDECQEFTAARDDLNRLGTMAEDVADEGESPGSVVTVVNVNRTMDDIPSMGETDGPMQFHHVTQRQLEARKAWIKEILRREA
jgi:hypothetical protein